MRSSLCPHLGDSRTPMHPPVRRRRDWLGFPARVLPSSTFSTIFELVDCVAPGPQDRNTAERVLPRILCDLIGPYLGYRRTSLSRLDFNLPQSYPPSHFLRPILIRLAKPSAVAPGPRVPSALLACADRCPFERCTRHASGQLAQIVSLFSSLSTSPVALHVSHRHFSCLELPVFVSEMKQGYLLAPVQVCSFHLRS
jgi:hypothetical protein